MRAATSPSTVVDIWHNVSKAFSDKPLFRHATPEGWKDLSYAEVDTITRELAAGLLAMGVGPGERVCIAASTRFEWMLSDIAIARAGAASVPIYASLLPDVCQFIVRDSGARVAIVEDAGQLEKLLPLCTENHPLRLIHIESDAQLEKPDATGRKSIKLAEVMAQSPAAVERLRSFADLQKSGKDWLAEEGNRRQLDERTNTVREDSIYTIIYTSGTTGMPKGVVLSHGCFTSGVSSGLRALAIEATDHQYLFLPLAHVLAREVAWAPILVGAVTSFSQGLTRIKDNLVQLRPTFMAGVPRIFEKFYSGVSGAMKEGSFFKKKLVKWAMSVGYRHSRALRDGKPSGGWQLALADKLVFAKLRNKLGLSNCRFMISGGAPLAAEIAEFFHATGLLILEGYGLTETVAAAFVNQLRRYRFGTVGPAIDVITVKIAEDGEILVRGPSVFKEYHNNPQATAEAIDTEGWFHTGDIGELEDGFLRITDRKKDLIVTAGGKKIAPQPIENNIKLACSTVGQVMVFGDKRPYCVALVTVAESVVAKHDGDYARAAAAPDVRAAIEAGIATVNKSLASFENIKTFAIAPADFSEQTGELTPSLKIKRKVVIAKYQATLDGMYRK
jgi:long-chain acyl-CoA synthetase